MKPKIVRWLNRGRENGPVTHAHSTRSIAHEGSRSTRLQQRTGEEGRHAPPKTRVLVVVAAELRRVSRAPLRPCADFGLRTRIDRMQLREMQGMRN